MNIKDLKSLYRFIKGTDIVELEFEGPDGKLKLRRAEQGGGVLSAPAAAPVVTQVSPQTLTSDGAGEVSEPAKMPDNVKLITSPMVGTFYSAPSPEVAPFVEIGAAISVGQPLCIIEAMKLMNEVESELSGKVIEILVDNGQPVEYGEALFMVEVRK